MTACNDCAGQADLHLQIISATCGLFDGYDKFNVECVSRHQVLIRSDCHDGEARVERDVGDSDLQLRFALLDVRSS